MLFRSALADHQDGERKTRQRLDAKTEELRAENQRLASVTDQLREANDRLGAEGERLRQENAQMASLDAHAREDVGRLEAAIDVASEERDKLVSILEILLERIELNTDDPDEQAQTADAPSAEIFDLATGISEAEETPLQTDDEEAATASAISARNEDYFADAVDDAPADSAKRLVERLRSTSEKEQEDRDANRGKNFMGRIKNLT